MLERYSPELATRERWLVLNKMDLIPEDEREQRGAEFTRAIGWSGPVYYISAVNGEGCKMLTGALMDRLEQLKQENEEIEHVESSEESEA
jgi:GTP-binding protein